MCCVWMGQRWAINGSMGLLVLFGVGLLIVGAMRNIEGRYAGPLPFVMAFNHLFAAFCLLIPPVQDFLDEQRIAWLRKPPVPYDKTEKDEAMLDFLAQAEDKPVETDGSEPPATQS